MKWLLFALCACGGSPPLDKPIANKPSHAQVTCEDAAVILRGMITSDDPKAGPQKEDALKRACTDGKWDPAVLECIGSSRTPNSCTDKLNEQQRDDLLAKLEEWEGQFPAPDAGADE